MMFIVNPDPYSSPTYRIGPFRTKDISKNFGMAKDDFADSYFTERFGRKSFHYTYNGRTAIGMALSTFGLLPSDVVTIKTTSGNSYISKCVTEEISRFCKWSMEIEPDTKVIFVNHEFGYPHPEIEELAATGLPIIEDCCTTLFSQNEKQMIGNYGQFTVYSFPKFIPIQIGGILLDNRVGGINTFQKLDENVLSYLKNVTSFYLRNLNKILEKREKVFQYAVQKFETLGFSERFENKESTVPSVLMLKNNSIVQNLEDLKTWLWQHGIQSSLFYGEDAFFIPCHQNLKKLDIDYFFEVIQYFIQHNDHS